MSRNLPPIPASQVAMLGRRQQQPTRAPGEMIAVFAAGKLKNPLNGAQWGKSARAKIRYRQEWHERVALALLEANWPRPPVHLKHAPPSASKHVKVVGHTHNRMDRDGLYAALKPVIDALVKCGVMDDDAEPVDGVGHVIECSQVIDRARRGVEIHVSLRQEPR